MYSRIVQEHVGHPRNVGPLEGATHMGTAGVPGNGPYMQLWLCVENGRIAQAAYQTYGCPAAIASASAITELAIGRSIEENLNLRVEDILQALGGLPEGKEHTAELAVSALRKAFQEEKQNG